MMIMRPPQHGHGCGERLRLGAITFTLIAGLARRIGYVEQFSRPRDGVGARASGEQAVVADAVEAAAAGRG